MIPQPGEAGTKIEIDGVGADPLVRPTILSAATGSVRLRLDEANQVSTVSLGQIAYRGAVDRAAIRGVLAILAAALSLTAGFVRDSTEHRARRSYAGFS